MFKTTYKGELYGIYCGTDNVLHILKYDLNTGTVLQDLTFSNASLARANAIIPWEDYFILLPNDWNYPCCKIDYNGTILATAGAGIAHSGGYATSPKVNKDFLYVDIQSGVYVIVFNLSTGTLIYQDSSELLNIDSRQ